MTFKSKKPNATVNIETKQSANNELSESASKHPAVMTEVQADDTHSNNETGGPKGLEPTRYGDWEAKGRCIDF